MGDQGMVNLQGLHELQDLRLDGTQVTDAGLLNLRGLTKNSSIINLSRTTSNGCGAGAESPRIDQTSVHQSHAATRVTDAGLVNLRGLTKLRYINLSATQVTDQGLIHLRGLTQLWSLALDNTPIDGTGLDHLAGLPNLRSLRLNGTQITDEGLAHLARLTNLRYLYLHATPITDEEGSCISRD